MFERLKEIMLNKIEKDSIKIDVNGEKVYLKKSGIIKEWHVIYPPVNPETKKWNKINLLFGGKANAIKTLIVSIIVVLLALGVYDVVTSYNATFSDPNVVACINQAGKELIGQIRG